MVRLQLKWLGYPEIILDAAPVKLETRKAIALLALLSVEAKTFAREALAAMFWPEHSQKRALANLRRLVFSLHQSLPDQLITDHASIALAPGYAVDVAAFRARVEALPGLTLDALEEAVQWYRGDFLQSFNLPDCPAFDDWQDFQREQLRRDLSAALAILAQKYVSQGLPDQAIQTASQRVTLDPLDDRAHSALMSIYAQTGQRNAALRQFETYADLLKTELDQSPEGEITRLYQRLARENGHTSPALSSPVTDQEPLFSAKLMVPLLRGAHVTRPRLTQRLAEGVQRALTLVSAPAGFGKTTIVADWAAHTALPVAWLSLDPQDNDPYRFARYLAAALRNVLPDGSHHSLAPHPQALMNFLGELAHRLALDGPPAILILDDYHVIDAPELHDAVAFLLHQMNTRIHCVIITRTDPPLPLARLRASDQLREIRAADLMFTPEEARIFLDPVAGLSDQDVIALSSGTEGWITGLQLIALSLRDQAASQIPAAIQALAGTHRHILDYLAEEVFNHQSTDVRTFLMQSSIPERINAPLSNTLTQRADSQRMLEQLESANLFLIPLDDERQWYRYHHLFREFLQKMLERNRPDDLYALHQRAGEWYRANGFASEAVSHLLAARDFEQAAILIQERAQHLLATRHLSTLLAWISALPAETRQRQVWLTIYQTWAHFCLEDLDTTETVLQTLEQQLQAGEFDSASAQTVQANIFLIRSNMAYLRGDHQLTLELAGQAQQLLGDAPHWLRNRLYFPMGQAYLLLGDLDRAEYAWMEAVRNNRQSGDVFSNVDTLSFLAALAKFRGQLHQAAQLYQEVQAIVDACGNPDLPVFGSLYVGLGDLLYEWNDLEQAAEYIRMGLECNRHRGDPLVLALTYVSLAWVHSAQGNSAEAADAFAQAMLLAKPHSPPLHIIDALIQLAVIRFHLDQGDLAGAAHRMNALRPADNRPIRFATIPLHLAHARVLFAQGELQEAQALLQELAEETEKKRHFGTHIKILIFQAVVYNAQHNLEDALRCLEASLMLAEPEGYMRVYLDGGPAVAQLLREAAHRHIRPGYVKRLLDAFPSSEH